MKKMISLFLALLMVFSVATVAFAAGDETPVDSQTSGSQSSEETPAASEDNKDETPATGEENKDETPAAEEKKDDEDSFDMEELLEKFKDMPSGEKKAVFKIGKIILKFVKLFAKLGIKFGLIDTDEIVKSVAETFGLDPETELPAGMSDAIRVLI